MIGEYERPNYFPNRAVEVELLMPFPMSGSGMALGTKFEEILTAC